ncbi:MAG: hypothetical protein ACI8QC_003018 [Planctomycetota bacterium]|jgi:hypothetical protein
MAPNTDNPYGHDFLLNNVTWPGLVPEFGLDGDPTSELTGPGNMLFESNIQPEAAEVLNDIFDRGVSSTWAKTGRVR